MNSIFKAIVMLAIAAMPATANAYPTRQTGKITNVSFAGDDVYIIMSIGMPDNCTGAISNWMLIPASAKITKAFILGLWVRGDVTQVQMTIYTSGKNSSNTCEINQIDPVE